MLDVHANNKGIAGVRIIQTNFWLKRLTAFKLGQEQLLELISNPEFIAGLMLYWAEGSKWRSTEVANSDIDLIVFMVKWFEQFFHISQKSLAVQMHIHSGQNEQNLRQYWSRVTKIPVDNFQRSYIKLQGTGHRTKKLYYGTIKLRVRGLGSTYLLFQILGSIAEYNNKVLGVKVETQKWIPKPKYAK